MSRILVGVTGGIAAYKVATVVSRLRDQGEVRVLMTRAATRFVAPLTFAALSDAPVVTDDNFYDSGGGVPHVRLVDWAQAYVVAPCTANTFAEMALGLASNVVSATALAFRRPMVVVPAMESGMWEHPTTQAHREALERRGVLVLEPKVGRLASGAQGVGRMPEPEEILEAVAFVLAPKDYQGVRAVVTAGPTREHLDPVRFLSNPSSGKMGYAFARCLARRGAAVTLVSGPTGLGAPAGVEVVRVTSTEEMAKAVFRSAEGAALVVAAGAPADFRPREVAAAKIPKDGLRLLPLEPTVDIVRELAAWERRPFLVGFAAETGDVVAKAEAKRRAKGLDLIVGNDVTEEGAGFGSDRNHVHILGPGWHEEVAGTKEAVADYILDRIRDLLPVP